MSKARIFNKLTFICQMVFSLVFISILAVGCGKKSEKGSSQPAPGRDGGVDGSGGELSYFTFDSFQDYLRTIHPAVMRDMVHRLIQLKENKELFVFYLNEFLGDDPTALMNRMQSIQYFAEEGACKSKNHPNGDAAYMPDGRICISHSAFKRFPFKEVVKKLIVISMHELGHMQKFEETKAVEWQLQFEGRLGGMTILFNNEKYKNFTEAFKKTVEHLGRSLKFLLRREEGTKILACESLARADEYSDTLVMNSFELPNHIQKLLKDQFSFGLFSATVNCNKNREKQIALDLGKILEKAVELRKIIANYESPFCSAGYCGGTYLAINPNPEDILQIWAVLKDWYLNGEPYPQSNDYECLAKDANTGENIPIDSSGGYKQILEKDGLYEDRVAISIEGTNGRFGEINQMVNIELGVGVNHKFIKGDGFQNSSFHQFHGYLQKGSKEKIWVRIGLLKYKKYESVSRLFGTEVKTSSRDLFLMGPYFMPAVREAPEQVREVEITCQLTSG